MHVKRLLESYSQFFGTPHTTLSPSTCMLSFPVVNRKRLLSIPNAGSCYARQTAFHTLKDIGIRKGLCAHWSGREAYTVRYTTDVALNAYALDTSTGEEYSWFVRLQRNDPV